jgi:hypothetical protein
MVKVTALAMLLLVAAGCELVLDDGAPRLVGIDAGDGGSEETVRDADSGEPTPAPPPTDPPRPPSTDASTSATDTGSPATDTGSPATDSAASGTKDTGAAAPPDGGDNACTGCATSFNTCTGNCGSTFVACEAGCKGSGQGCQMKCAMDAQMCGTACQMTCQMCAMHAACTGPTAPMCTLPAP